MQKPTEIITSRQNPLLTLAAKLSERKHREAQGLFRFDGKKLFAEALEARLPLTAVLLRESAVPTVLSAVADRSLPEGCRAVMLPDALFDRISEEKSPDGVMVIAKHLDKIRKIDTIDKWRELFLEQNAARVLFLESIRDPGNLGTIIRSACAFGADLLVLSGDCADVYHPRVLRASMGALFRERVFVTPHLADAVRAYGERGRVFAAMLDERSERLGEIAFQKGDAVLIGNEGHGLSKDVIGAANHRVYIPMAPGVESLNAGVAASVLLWELQRSDTHE